jgi:hypothetical protein
MLRFVHERCELPAPETGEEARYLAIQPIAGVDAQRYIGLTEAGDLFRIDLDEGHSVYAATVSDLNIVQPGSGGFRLSADDRFAAVFAPRGRYGAVCDLNADRVTMRLDRGDYHEEHCVYSVAFFVHRGRQLLVHATDWNHLDISDPATGELLTGRTIATYERDQPRPDHYLDYFHCGLAVSPDGGWIADNGWAWHPVGVPRTWSLQRWLEENVWESEDGPTVKELCGRDIWDGPMCWLDNHRLALWGGGDDEPLSDTVRVFDVESGLETMTFTGPPNAALVFDEWLLSLGGAAATVWDVVTGERLFSGEGFNRPVYHPGARTVLSWGDDGAATVSRLAGRPAPPWLSPDALNVARAIAAGRDWAALPVLADALEEAGCDDARILTHLRQPGPHGRGCWAVRRLLEG